MRKREVPYISYQDFLLKVLEMAEFLTYHRKKILVVFVISALLMTGLCGQLGFLMIARSDHYSKMADEELQFMAELRSRQTAPNGMAPASKVGRFANAKG